MAPKGKALAKNPSKQPIPTPSTRSKNPQKSQGASSSSQLKRKKVVEWESSPEQSEGEDEDIEEMFMESEEEEVAVEERDEGPVMNNPCEARGGGVKEEVHPGGTCDGSQLNGTVSWALFERQGWTRYLTFNGPTNPEYVRWFYKHASVVLDKDEKKVRIEVVYGSGRKYTFTSKDFKDLWGVNSRGFSDVKGLVWPLEDTSYEETVSELNGDGAIPATGTTPIIAKTNALRGDDRLTFRILSDCVLGSTPKDGRIPVPTVAMMAVLKSQRGYLNLPLIVGKIMHDTMTTARTSVFPFGMLVTHIVGRWRVMGERVITGGRTRMVFDQRMLASMGLQFDERREHLTSKWEREAQTPSRPVEGSRGGASGSRSRTGRTSGAGRSPGEMQGLRTEMQTLRRGQRVLYDRQTAMMTSLNNLCQYTALQGQRQGIPQDEISMLSQMRLDDYPLPAGHADVGEWFMDHMADEGGAAGDDEEE